VDPDNIRVVHGDTGQTPYSTGTWGSRCMVMAGGAVSTACKEIRGRIEKIGAKLMQSKPDDVALEGGRVVSASSSVSLAEVASTWYLAPQNLPVDVDRGGLEVTAGYRPDPDSGTFSYAAHAVTVAVDTETGAVELLDYVIVEDGGKLVNPMIVDGQIYGGMAQGIGTALYEEMAFNQQGQPLGSTFADYLLPGPAEVPEPRITHLETLSPWTEFGVKGIGEGGAIAPPAAIANAINDALKPLGVELTVSPITPRRIVEAIAQARRR
jgi:aerobic carbon-monoxide dehydrogenase large subunit